MTANFTIYNGDCADKLRQLPDNSVDSVCSDPPSGISFMGKSWDSDKGGRDQWIAWLAGIMKEVYRVLKPGGHAFIWALPRTSHWTGMALEKAGFEVRDCVSYLYDSNNDVQAFIETLSPEQRTMLEIILANYDDSYNVFQHLFGSGFPKSLDISKAIQKAEGEQPIDVVPASLGMANNPQRNSLKNQLIMPAPATPQAKQWQGFGSALKPSSEFWWLVRKPLSEPTLAANVLRWGCGGINIDGCRVATGDDTSRLQTTDTPKFNGKYNNGKVYNTPLGMINGGNDLGRFPSHTIIDGSDTVEAEFAKAGVRSSGAKLPIEPDNSLPTVNFRSGTRIRLNSGVALEPSTGSASRFFYCAKPSPSERNDGLEGFEKHDAREFIQTGIDGRGREYETQPRANHHPTVKSISLSEYLITMITPPGGTVLDMFMGSGTTGVAALRKNFKFIGIEKEAEYFTIAEARIRHAACGQAGEVIASEPITPSARPKLQPSLF